MILGLKEDSPEYGRHYFGKVNGEDKRFVRVVAGLMMGHLDRQICALVVLAERYQRVRPMDIDGIAAMTGSWADVKAGILKYREQAHFDHLIAEDKAHSDQLNRNMPELRAIKEPCIIYHAPAQAVGEMGRQTVDALAGEGRLHLEMIMRDLDHEPEQGAKAIQFAVCYMMEFPAMYPNQNRTKQPKYENLWGVTGL